MQPTQQNGFTLFELMMVMVVAGILLGWGVPSFREFQRNSAMTSAANDLITGLLTARAEAVKRQVPVTLCASPDPLAANPVCSQNGAGANGGFIVWVDWDATHVDANKNPTFTASDGNAVVEAGELAGNPVLMRAVAPASAAPAGTLNVFGNSGYVSFGANGFVRNPTAPPSATWVLYCDDRGNRSSTAGLSSARAVRIDPTGRAYVLTNTADIVTAVAATGGACP